MSTFNDEIGFKLLLKILQFCIIFVNQQRGNPFLTMS